MRNSTNGSLEYIYDATGNKLAKKLNGAFVNFYCGSVVYTGSKTPEYVAHSQGMARANGSAWNYQYNLTDHLGNVRYATDAGKTFEQSTDYFPFGLAHSTTPTGLAKNKYLYNGKELQTELGFNLLDYHARFYDATIGILDQIDPMVEKYYGFSPYTYCANNPLVIIDPSGEKLYFTFDKKRSVEDIEKMKASLTEEINHMMKGQFEVVFKNTGGTTYQIELKALEGNKNLLTRGGKAFHEGLNGVINSEKNVNINVVYGSSRVNTGDFNLEAIDIADIKQFPQFDLSKIEQIGPTRQGKLMHEIREQYSKVLGEKNYARAHKTAGIYWEDYVNGNIRVGDYVQTFYRDIGDKSKREKKQGEILSQWTIGKRTAILSVTRNK